MIIKFVSQAQSELVDAVAYISYTLRDSVIWVLAIAHAHSRPEYWIDRPQADE